MSITPSSSSRIPFHPLPSSSGNGAGTQVDPSLQERIERAKKMGGFNLLDGGHHFPMDSEPLPETSTSDSSLSVIPEIEAIKQRFPSLLVRDASFWASKGLMVDEIPKVFTLEEIQIFLDAVERAGGVEKDAGVTLMLLPKDFEESKFRHIGMSYSYYFQGKPDAVIAGAESSSAYPKTHWVLITNNIIKGSQKMDVLEQRRFCENSGCEQSSILTQLAQIVAVDDIKSEKYMYTGTYCWEYDRGGSTSIEYYPNKRFIDLEIDAQVMIRKGGGSQSDSIGTSFTLRKRRWAKGFNHVQRLAAGDNGSSSCVIS